MKANVLELKKIGKILGVVVGLAVFWGVLGEKIWQQARQDSQPSKTIIFNNGTVRSHRQLENADADGMQERELRKCQTGQEVIYMDTPCPKGSKVFAVAKTPINNLEFAPEKADQKLAATWGKNPKKTPQQEGRELADIKAARIDAVVGQ